MIAARLPRVDLWPAFRKTARRLIAADIQPDTIDWEVEGMPAGLFADPVPDAEGPAFTLPKPLASLMKDLTAVRGAEGLCLAYRLLWRARNGGLRLDNRADAEISRARALAKSVHRDLHKMHAFVRFQERAPGAAPTSNRRRFTAWFEPDHRIEEAAAPFFAKRFGDMDWIIRTPEVTMTFVDGKTSLTAQSNTREIGEDALEALWCSYYTHIFNPARLKVSAMTSEMPRKYWHNLPEAHLIPGLIAQAEARRDAMIVAGRTPDAADLPVGTLSDLPDALTRCARCAIGCHATQAVPGEGSKDAALMIVGEQPGDSEDRAGRPFVGPAGQLLDQALRQAGIDRRTVYLTNAVKHFKFIRKGTRRLHARPERTEIEACRWWLDIERDLVAPKLTLAMGATAAHALTGTGERLLDRRGRIEQDAAGRPVFVTVHPAWILRRPDKAQRADELDRLAEEIFQANYFTA